MTSSIFCTHCGKRFADGDRVCTECGRGRSPDPATSAQPPFEASSPSLDPPARRYDGPGAYRKEAASPEDARSAPLAGWDRRVPAFLITTFLPSLLGLIPVVGQVLSLGLGVLTLCLYRRGLDIGARLMGVRVVRDTGELAGFFHMATRQYAAFISLIVVGAGFWTAFSDPRRRTWHDKMMGTYVVQNHPGLDDLPGTSSTAAVVWFWILTLISLSLTLIFVVFALSFAQY